MLAIVLVLSAGCARSGSPGPASTVAATPRPVSTPGAATAASTTPGVTPSATPAATTVAGQTVQVGGVNVVTAHFSAQVSEPDGVNIRSSPQVTPDNRTGSLPSGSQVDVEGTAQGQEAVSGQGTNWYYLGTVGASPPLPQFIYGPAGTLTPLSASATPSAGATASPSAIAATAPPSATAAAGTPSSSPASPTATP